MSASDQAKETPKVAAATEQDILLNHEYDGIREYDNPLPRWWKQLFIFSILFSIGYVFHYHLGSGTSIQSAYEADMRQHRALRARYASKQTVSEESLSELMLDPGTLEAGKSLFLLRCQQCHADQGQGNIGPNLTDESWIHGDGTLMSIYEVVSNGVLAKGMPAWNLQLTPKELKQIVAYVGTLRNTNIPGKPPEGTPQGGAPP